MIDPDKAGYTYEFLSFGKVEETSLLIDPSTKYVSL